jgi:hypothetical protein
VKYQQPYGITDPEAPYINGNPSTGTMGSIPPAASIEHPQREIVNLIKDAAAVTPVETDLHQLGKSLQSGKINYGVDIGVVNAAIVPLSPIPDAYYAGMVVRFKAKFAPTAATTLDAGRGARSVVKSGGAVLQGSEWSIGDIITVTYEGVTQHWQLPPSPIAMLYAPKDFYVNNATGNDSNDGLTAGSAFKTLQRAQDMTKVYNLNGYTITIHVADGTYPAGVSGGTINGTGQIYYLGNTANPQACNVASTAGPAFAFQGAQTITIDGFSVSATGTQPGMPAAGVWAAGSSIIICKAMNFHTCNNGQIIAEAGAVIGYSGPFTITGQSFAHLYALNGSSIRSGLYPSTLTVMNPVNLTYFMAASGNAQMLIGPIIVNNPANVYGYKFIAQVNAIIVSGGNSVSYYPGNVAGVLSTGGQYV